MVGRDVELERRREPGEIGEVVLEADGLSRARRPRRRRAAGRLARRAGRRGARRRGRRRATASASSPRCSPGCGRRARASSRSKGNACATATRERRSAAGVAHVPEDRLRTGVAPSLSIASNVVLKSYRGGGVSRGPFLLLRRIARRAVELIRRYDVRGAGPTRAGAAPLGRQPAEGRARAGVLEPTEGARRRGADPRARRRRDRDRPRIPARRGGGRRRRAADQRGPRRDPHPRRPDRRDVRGRDRRARSTRVPRASRRSGCSWRACA